MNRKNIILIAAAGIMAAVVFFVVRKKRKESGKTQNDSDNTGVIKNYNPNGISRGDRNNNPLNLRYNKSINWDGQIGTDGAFAVFSSRTYGYRAAIKNLISYIKNGNNTIKKIITRWAPPSDGNNTTGYIENVANRSAINADLQIAITDKEKIFKIVREMAKIESLLTPADAELEQAWKLI